jgi:hypothetical protein
MNIVRLRIAGLGVGLASIFVILGAGACSSDVANRYYASEKFPPKAESEVEVLREPPSRPHVIIADFQSRGEGERAMRRKAAAIGADAVIVQFLGGQVKASSEWAGSASNGTYTRITGTAIRYK